MPPFAIFVFGFGLIIGSFLNAVIYRLHTRESIFAKSSHCPHCGHALSWLDLVPVASFFALSRKCRYCGQPISWQYPLVELATGLAFVLVYLNVAASSLSGASIFLPSTIYHLLFQLAFSCVLIIIFVYDLKHYLILDEVLLAGGLLALVYDLLRGQILSGMAGVLFLAGFFALLFFVSRGRWIGAGDIKLGVFLGLLVPFPQTLVLFFLAYFLGAAVSLGLIALGRKRFSDILPFGTFLTFAAFLAMLWGQPVAQWYFHLIGLQ